MKELTVGLKTNKELAEWMGITEGSFRATKKKCLERLEYFADFHTNGSGKVIIDEVYDPIYDKAKTKPAQEILEKVPEYWDKSGLDTIKHCAFVMHESEKEKDPNSKIAQLAFSTVRQYTSKGRTYWWGNPLDESLGNGIAGWSMYLWCKINDDGKPEMFTEEEIKIKDALYEEIFGNANDRELFLFEEWDAGRVSTERIGKAYEKVFKEKYRQKYGLFLSALRQRLGVKAIGKGTQIYLEDMDNRTFPSVEEGKENQRAAGY